MCPILADFKHFPTAKGSDSRLSRNVSSIMRAKVLSIMRGGDSGLTSLFKPIPKAPRYGLRIDREHNPGGETKP
jgi:hypothetical protein